MKKSGVSHKKRTEMKLHHNVVIGISFPLIQNDIYVLLGHWKVQDQVNETNRTHLHRNSKVS